MPSNDRRAAARRRAWGRGPAILKFEPLEGRQVLSVTDPVSALAAAATSPEQAGNASTSSTTAIATTSTATASETAAIASTVASTATASSASSTATGATSTSTSASTSATSTPSNDVSSLAVTSFDTGHNLDWGDDTHAIGAITNDGSAPTGPAKVNVYASSTPTPGKDAVLVGSVPIAGGIEPGQTVSFDGVISAPPVPLKDIGNAPTFFLTPKLAPASTNSTAMRVASTAATVPASSLQSVVTITPKIPPKLVGAGISVAPGSVRWGDTINVTASVKNDAQGDAPPTNARIVLTPVGQSVGGPNDYQIGLVPIPPISPYQTVTATQAITLPSFPPNALASSGQFTVAMVQDADATASPLLLPTVKLTPNDMTTLKIAPSTTSSSTPIPSPAGSSGSTASSGSTTSPGSTSPSGSSTGGMTASTGSSSSAGTTTATSTPTPPKPPSPNLKLVSVSEPSPVMFRGSTFPVGATIENDGQGNSGPFKVRFLLTENDAPNSPALVLGDAQIPGLAAGMRQDVLQTVKLPYRVPDGFSADASTGRIVAVVDPDHAIDQTTRTDDTLAAPVVGLKLLAPDAPADQTTQTGAVATTTASPTPAKPSTPAPSTPAPSNPTATTVTTTSVATASATPRGPHARAAARQAKLAAAKQHRLNARHAASQHKLRVVHPPAHIVKGPHSFLRKKG